ncbi:ribonuclease P protein component [Kordia algicida OT-1]|uniref:Ribonuclease P protein component n=1 Tax=Kordia algicida OT-1 TaxID=391587 RepID=A9DRI4_9FLAO|nr:ribonuclease P protein component [Kordia algicida]EDP96798.1 RNase P protein, subunit A [Kordia algicida OT-1]
MNYRFPKEEKLKSKKCLDLLFSEGGAVSKFPLRLVYIATDLPKDVQIQAGVSVTKRRFKKAVTRNRIKRLMREAYRLHKNDVFNTISTSYAFMFLYIGKKEPTFEEIEKSMIRLLQKFLEKTNTIDAPEKE